MKYPTDIISDDHGWHRIHKGHGLDSDLLRADLEEHVDLQRIGEELIVKEVHLRYVPRVKWCERLDGWSCDDQGDWHSHWVEVKPNPERAMTIVYWGKP